MSDMSPEDIKVVYQRRRGFAILIAVVGVLLLLVFLYEATYREQTAFYYAMLLALIVMMAGSLAVNRCPACGSSVNTRWMPRYCPSCGVELSDPPTDDDPY